MSMILCPTCGGVGHIPVPMPSGTIMGYCGPNGEGWPMEICRSCGGQRWVPAPQSVSNKPCHPCPCLPPAGVSPSGIQDITLLPGIITWINSSTISLTTSFTLEVS